MDVDSIRRYLRGKVSIICHHNADPDAICSAYAFSSLLKQTRPNIEVEIGAAHGISRLSKHLLQYLTIDIKEQPNTENANAIIVVEILHLLHDVFN